MRTNRKLLSGFALVLVAVVFFWVWSAFKPAPPPKVAEVPADSGTPAAVPVANTGRLVARAVENIPQGVVVVPGMYQLVSDPNSEEVKTAVLPNQLNGYITSDIIAAGSAINKTDLVGPLSDLGIAGTIRPGYRAMVVPITAKPGLHDLVHIGNYVDIYAAFDGEEARTVVQNVRVLAVDDSAQDYPNYNAAMRGPYKADIKNGVPPEAVSAAPLPPGATPTPTPTPGPAAGAPAPPSQALTLEVLPKDAARLLLVQASGATFDFLLRAPVPVVPATGEGSVPAEPVDLPVSVTKPEIAPYSSALKNPPVQHGGSSGFRNTGFERPQPTFPPMVPPATLTGLGPLTPVATPEPSTYDIPVYADGKLERTETVQRPNDQE